MNILLNEKLGPTLATCVAWSSFPWAHLHLHPRLTISSSTEGFHQDNEPFSFLFFFVFFSKVRDHFLEFFFFLFLKMVFPCLQSKTNWTNKISKSFYLDFNNLIKVMIPLTISSFEKWIVVFLFNFVDTKKSTIKFIEVQRVG